MKTREEIARLTATVEDLRETFDRSFQRSRALGSMCKCAPFWVHALRLRRYETNWRLFLGKLRQS